MEPNAIRGPGAPTGSRVSGAARANLAGALGTVWATCGAPGSVLLTLFLQDWLHAEKWQIGLLITMTFLGPTFEPPGAYLVERLGRRRPLFLLLFLVNRLPFLTFALVPFLEPTGPGRLWGIALVLAVVGLTRVPAHLGNPAWWSWMADLVPERRRGRFFGCRGQATSAVQAVSFIVAMLLLHGQGGMANRALVSALFGVGALFGILDILIYLTVPEPPLRAARPALPGAPQQSAAGAFLAPFRRPEFRRLLVGMGLWSFSANLVLPFLPVYQHGEVLNGQPLGLGLTWKFLAVLNVSGSLAAMLSSRLWARWGERIGPRRLLALGSGHLFVNLAYLVVRPGQEGWLVPVALAGGALNAAWTVSVNQLLLGLAPRENRSYYISAFNFTNGWLMAGGPLLGGLLADRLPLLGWGLPGGLPCCYFHLLLALATAGGLLAVAFLVREPSAAPAAEARRAPPPTWLWIRLSLSEEESQAVDKRRKYATL